MKKRLAMLAYAIVCAALVAVHAHGVVLFVDSLRDAREMSCVFRGAPREVEDACRDGVWLASWGMQ